MKPHAQIVVTINSDNDVSVTIRTHDGNAPTFDEGEPIADNTISSHRRDTYHPQFSKPPHDFEVAAVDTAAKYLAEAVASSPRVRTQSSSPAGRESTEDDATGQSPLPQASPAD